MLTIPVNPPVATALPIAAPPVATAVARTHFVVSRGGPPVATGGHRWGKISCCIQSIAKIVTRTCINFVDSPAFTSALEAFVICLFCLSYICSAALRTPGAKIVLIVADFLECRSKFLKIYITFGFHNEIMNFNDFP